jgi:hypothetical protein
VMLLEMADNALNGGTRFELALDLNCDAALRAWEQRERHWLRCDACFVPAAGCCCGSTPSPPLPIYGRRGSERPQVSLIVGTAVVAEYLSSHSRGLRMRASSMTLVAALAVAGYSDAVKEIKGEKGDIGEKGEPGPAGPPGEKGEKGDAGAPGTTLRVVSPRSPIASCESDEIMISAYCIGTFNNYPLVPFANGARCGDDPDSTTLRVTIVCAKR